MKNVNVKGSEARKRLKAGVDAVADAVKVSYGAEGRNVIFPAGGKGFVITKDGVSIARSIFPEGWIEAVGANMVKEAASKANYEAGDGTSAASVLTQAIFNEVITLVDSGASAVDVKAGAEAACADLVKYLDKASKKVSKRNLEKVATISANGDEKLGKIISEAFNRIGEHGVVISEVSDTAETYIEVKQGVQLDRGFYHEEFVTNPLRNVCELDNPLVLLHKGKISKGDAIKNLLDKVYSNSKNSLLIITDDIDPFILSTFVQNSRSGAIKGRICIVKTPQILKIDKNLLADVAKLSGAAVVSEIDGVKLTASALGRLNKAVISEKDTLLVGNEENLTDTIVLLKELIEKEKNLENKKDLQERLSRITGGVATLFIGAKTDSELEEKKDRIEDSINATRSALEEGIVPGGGVALFEAMLSVDASPLDESKSDSFHKGYKAVLNSCLAPMIQINANAGIDVEEFINSAEVSDGFGIDAKTGKIVDMIKHGIVDPKKVTRCSLQNAVSVVSTFLMTEVVVEPLNN